MSRLTSALIVSGPDDDALKEQWEKQKNLFVEIGLLAESYQDDDESVEDDGANAISGHWWNMACRELGHPEMEVKE